MSIFKDQFPRMGASGQSTGYEIDQSIRFDSGDNAKMTRTPSSAGNRRTFTFSSWIKRATLTTDQVVFGSYINTTNYFLMYFDSNNHSSDNTFRVYEYNGNVLKFWVYGKQSFRDPSAWYHFVVSVDTTNADSNERIRLYVNGSRITDLTQNQQPALNYETYINSTNLQTIGEFYSNYYHLDAYMADIHLLDGYAYGPEFFGEFKDDTDIWIPKEYTGSYGTNGFKIDGRDASDLGDDESGQGNDYTTSGLVATDQRTDSPTNNHATWNGLLNRYPSYANGNIEATMTTSNKWAKTVMNMTLPNTGTWYWEGTEFNPENDPATALGIVDSDVEVLIDNSVSNRFSTPMSTFTGIVVYSGPGQSLATYEYKNGSETSTSGAVIISTSRLGFLWEPENNRFTIYDDGSQYQQFTSINAGNYVFGAQQATGGVTLNYRIFVEANDWTQTPAGITSANALNTKNIGS